MMNVNEPDIINTQEVIQMLDVIYKGVEIGCKDRCYIKGSSADSVKWVLELAIKLLSEYARAGISHLKYKKLSTNYRVDSTMEEVYGADSDVIKKLAEGVIEDELGGMIGEFIKYKTVEIVGTKYVYGSLYVGVGDDA
jgi:hypothetical protein